MDGIAYDASRASLTHPNWAPEEPGQPNPAHAGAGAIRDSDDIASVLRLRSLSEAKALRLWRLTYCIYANTTACPSGCRVPQASNYQRTGSMQCVQLRGSRSSPSWCVRQAFPSTTIQSSGAPVYQIGSPRATNAARICTFLSRPGARGRLSPDSAVYKQQYLSWHLLQARQGMPEAHISITYARRTVQWHECYFGSAVRTVMWSKRSGEASGSFWGDLSFRLRPRRRRRLIVSLREPL